MAGYAAEAGAAAGAGRGRAARHPPLTSLVVSTIAAFSAVVVFAILRSAYDAAVSRTTTLLGHNLEPTPWHLFKHDKGRPPARAAFRCAPSLTCRPPVAQPAPGTTNASANASAAPRLCPAYFGAIRRDLAPWRRGGGGVTRALLDAAQRRASMRVAITGGGRRLHVELYYACVQSRALFTAWSLLQLMRRYPGRVPDVELMFDCMDRPAINRRRCSATAPPGTTSTSLSLIGPSGAGLKRTSSRGARSSGTSRKGPRQSNGKTEWQRRTGRATLTWRRH